MKPAFDTFVAPSRKHADIIIPWGGCRQRALLHGSLPSIATLYIASLT